MATQEQRNLRVPGYVLLQKLCTGQQAKVYKAQSSQTYGGGVFGDEVAVKMFRGRDSQAALQRELRFLNTVQGHQNVVRIVESISDTPRVRALVLELCDKDLWTMTSERVFSEADAAIMMRGVLSALRHIHMLRVVHRDIKPENIAVGRDGAARFMDFGISAWMYDDIEMHRKCGSPGYMAPEIIDQKFYGPPVDIFAFGATMYFMLCNHHPFETESGTLDSTMAKTKFCVISFGINFDHVGDDTRKLISWCVHEDATWRPDAKFAFTCPPFTPRDVGEEDHRPMSFEEQLEARIGMEAQSPAHAVPRVRPERPTPFLRRESAPRPADKEAAADVVAQQAPRGGMGFLPRLVEAPGQPSDESKACNVFGSPMCERVSTSFGEAVGKSQGATSVSRNEGLVHARAREDGSFHVHA
eukprot:TRINITY_DN5036_c0_g1_i2.p1 TRINITY_DN5036_c0_g1~~TRINITY_DN5036_c0_g1_i2.p1  ORF type:complete len:414 (+),score=56.95 TRINITY_DN5036_c0_g1_i2:41-1282(+)